MTNMACIEWQVAGSNRWYAFLTESVITSLQPTVDEAALICLLLAKRVQEEGWKEATQPFIPCGPQTVNHGTLGNQPGEHCENKSPTTLYNGKGL